MNPLGAWLERIDPGANRRIKGLRLATAFAIAALGGSLYANTHVLARGEVLGMLAARFALWGSVSEARATRVESTRDLLLLAAAAVTGALLTIALVPIIGPWPELVLAIGAFLVGYLRRFGVTGTGIGSQFFIGQLLAYNADLAPIAMPVVCVAGIIAAVATIVPRVLSGPAEHPPTPLPAPTIAPGWVSAALAMGLQAATATVVIVGLNGVLRLEESIWAITACAYVVAGSMATTIDRVRRRILGTAVGVPLGLALLPAAVDFPLAIWLSAAVAIVIYAMALPDRYDVACAAYAYTLVVTLAATGEHSVALLAARLWETVLGGLVGMAAAAFVFPLKSPRLE